MTSLTQPQSTAVVAASAAKLPRLKQRITLVCHNRSILVATEDIIWLEGSGNYTYIHTRDKRRYLMAKTLKMFEAELTGSSFARIHKSHVVNLAHVRTINFGDDASIELQGGRTLAIARRRVTSTLNQYLHHQQLTTNLN
ncbi:LytR/AlgR family response regulator transcription factor [Spirosoma koreense]